MNASADRAAFMQQKREAMFERLKRAVSNVMGSGGDISIHAAAVNHSVSEGALREALKEAGWRPPRRVRTNNSRSRAKVAR